jgi:hypothetical protein
VFAGGFGLADPEAIAADRDAPAGEVLGLLGVPVDKTPAQLGAPGTGPGQYWRLKTVRQCAAGWRDASLGRFRRYQTAAHPLPN